MIIAHSNQKIYSPGQNFVRDALFLIIGHLLTCIDMAGITTMDNSQVYTDGGTFQVNAFFGEKLTLGQILAARVLRDLEKKTLENQGELTCLSENSEV